MMVPALRVGDTGQVLGANGRTLVSRVGGVLRFDQVDDLDLHAGWDLAAHSCLQVNCVVGLRVHRTMSAS